MNKISASSGRQSNIELLRIVAMVMIVASHFGVHGGFNYGEEISLNSVWITFFGSGGKLGVDIFMLISGYFAVMSTRFRFSRVLRLWLQGFFYAVGIYLVLVLTKMVKFKTVDLLLNFIPVSGNIIPVKSVYNQILIKDTIQMIQLMTDASCQQIRSLYGDGLHISVQRLAYNMLWSGNLSAEARK